MFARFSFILPLVLSACMSTADDPLYRQIDWSKSEEYKACKAKEDRSLAEYKVAKSAYDKAKSKYDYDAEMKKFEHEVAEFEAGERKLMPLRPSIIGQAGLPPMIPAVGQCFRPPEGWGQE